MALLNNVYIFVEDEDLSHNVESTSHPVEKGVPITDHVQVNPIGLSLKGKIVNAPNGAKAVAVLSVLKQWQKQGRLMTYVGRNTVSNLQIQDFQTSHPYTNWGGCDFTMTLKEVRIAKPAYVAPKENANHAGLQQVEKGTDDKVYYTVKKGDCIWNLVTGSYKSCTYKTENGKTVETKTTMSKCQLVMNNNQSAFSRKGDFRTLQIGKKLFMGYRK